MLDALRIRALKYVELASGPDPGRISVFFVRTPAEGLSSDSWCETHVDPQKRWNSRVYSPSHKVSLNQFRS